ncbi:hypothetical protein [Mitsuaria sp. 7]|uniref:hypothetical protein n=1 Tax=Mitsuaria sp. 7 TaxID=1658665 RepID=UPI0007DDB232|nr:hypothetical protein [Mitsuaria sp. 7]ANH67545.1 hypothetical protein ABE85_08135 [Mitsuaria sp. 7]
MQPLFATLHPSPQITRPDDPFAADGSDRLDGFDLPPDCYHEEPFVANLLARHASGRNRTAQQIRDYRARTADSVNGRDPAAQHFDAGVDFLAVGPEYPAYKRRLRTLHVLGDKFPRVSSPSDPRTALLCDRLGQPRLAFHPATDGGTALRESMASAFDTALSSRYGLSLGIGLPVPHPVARGGAGTLSLAPGRFPEPLPGAFSTYRQRGAEAEPGVRQAIRQRLQTVSAQALQSTALSRLFTNRWQGEWERQLFDAQGRCWHLDAGASFPEDDVLGPALDGMSNDGRLAPLFRVPDDAGAAWDAPFDPDLAEKVLSIDTHALRWPLELELDRVLKAGVPSAPGNAHLAAKLLSRTAVRRSFDAIDAVQSLLMRNPVMSLRELLSQYPARIRDWIDDEPSAALPLPRQPPRKPPRTPITPPAVRPQSTAAAPTAEFLITNAELSERLQKASPFSPFKRRDRALAPLLRDAIALRQMKDGPKRLRAAGKLRDGAVAAIQRISSKLERGGPVAQSDIDAANGRLATLFRLIHDTESRHGLPALAERIETPTQRGRSWLPWRRGTKRQA